MALATFDCAESEKPFFLPKMHFFGGVETLGRALSSESFQVIPIFSNAKPVPVVGHVGFISNLDRSIILSKFVVSGVSRCPRFHTGAKHHNTFRERVNSVRNACEQVTQFSRLDGCVAYQILHLCQARAFLSVSRGSHTRASFQMCSIAFRAFLFSRRATDAVFRKTRHLATFRRTDAPAQIRDAHKTGLLKFARGMGVQQKGRWNGYARGTDTCLLKSFF